MDLRLPGIAQGSTGDPMASSGLNASVFGACARHATLVGVLDVSLRGLARYWKRVCREFTWDAVVARMLPHLAQAALPRRVESRGSHA